MQDDRIIIPSLSIHPHYIALYNTYKHSSTQLPKTNIQKDNLRRNTHNNTISKKTHSKITKAINYLLLTATDKPQYNHLSFDKYKFRLAFITLTLSSQQIHSDNYIKSHMLNQFLIEAKRLWSIEKYVWRAEHQQNGNIHFHILVDKFVPYQELRGIWNRIQFKEGYIKQYEVNMREFHKNGFNVRKDLLAKWSYKEQLKAYKYGIKTNWHDPNSTDVHSLQFIHNISAYITKYMSKDNKHNHYKVHHSQLNYKMRHVKGKHSLSVNVLKFLRLQAEVGRLWACSYQLSSIKGATDVIDSDIEKELNILLSSKEVKTIDDSNYTIILIGINELIKYRCIRIIELFSEFVVEKFILSDS